MCELLGLNANVPTDICFSFTGLVQRGGRTGPHRDGWGMSIYEGRAARSFHDPRPSVASEIAEFLQRHAIRSEIIIGHIRKANRGKVSLANTHPFQRELWGSVWSFAHNGQLKGIKKRALERYRPAGSTDSEYAFCWLLDQVLERFPERPKQPRVVWRFLRELADDLDSSGVFNFLMSDSYVLYAYCSTRLVWLTRRHPFGVASLIDTGETFDFREVTTPKDIVTIIGSTALTDNEEWHSVPRGSMLVFRDGLPVARFERELVAA